KKGNFDDRIDQYLGETPGLLPRGSAEADDSTGPISKIDLEPEPAAMSRAPTEADARAAIAQASKIGVARPVPGTQPMATRPGTVGGADGRAPAPRVTLPRSAMTPPPVVSRPVIENTGAPTRRDVVPLGASVGAEEDIAEVHSPAPSSAAVPPGAAPGKPGEY